MASRYMSESVNPTNTHQRPRIHVDAASRSRSPLPSPFYTLKLEKLHVTHRGLWITTFVLENRPLEGIFTLLHERYESVQQVQFRVLTCRLAAVARVPVACLRSRVD